MAVNGCNWLDMTGMTGNGWKLLEMAGMDEHGWNGRKWNFLM